MVELFAALVRFIFWNNDLIVGGLKVIVLYGSRAFSVIHCVCRKMCGLYFDLVFGL